MRGTPHPSDTTRAPSRAWRVAVDLRRYRSDGTLDIVGGGVVAGVAALLYEVVGGRALGADGFAPVGALLTLHFLVFLIVLVPLEQVTIRRLTIDPTRPGIPVGAVSVVSGAAVLGATFGWILRDRLFAGDGFFALLVAGTTLTHGVFALARGYLAGRRRFRSYGLSSGAASVFRLALGAVVVALTLGDRLFGLALVVGPLVIAGWRPFGRSVDAQPGRSSGVVDTGAAEGRMVFGLAIASAAAQTMLLAGPLVAALAGAGRAEVSVVFVTFSLMRAPLSLGYNLVARVVPPLTAMAERGEYGRLSWLTTRGGSVTVASAFVGGGAGYWVGPGLISSVFGAEFRPDPWFAALVASGVVIAAGSLLAGQVFVARGDTGHLADAWLVATAVALALVVVPWSDTSTRIAAAFAAGELCALALLVSKSRRPPAGAAQRAAAARHSNPTKRLLDVLVGGLLLLLLLPIMAVVAVAVRLSSGRPVVLAQTRVGRGGAPFTMWKFRTMVPDADPAVFWAHIRDLAAAPPTGANPPDLSIPDDPRLTSLGRRLRHWSLDELPNLWNVVRGDMSLVGPRPLLPIEVELIRSRLGGEAATTRATVLPGVTGLAQIEGRDHITLEERSELDLRYVRERSFSLDVWLLLRTAVGVFRHRGI